MNLVGDLLAVVFILGGLFFFAVGAIGIVRLPDVYHRIHAMSKATTLGVMGLLIGAILHIGTPNVLIMSLLTLLFAFVATPRRLAHARQGRAACRRPAVGEDAERRARGGRRGGAMTKHE